MSLVPLRDLLTVVVAGPLTATATVQIVGNLLVFAALGFLAPLRFAALASRRWWRGTGGAVHGSDRRTRASSRSGNC